MKDQVDEILGHFKPFFHAHGGDFEVSDVTDDGTVKVKLVGECVLCQLKDKTAEGMTIALQNAIPGVQGIEIED
ncbi:MAG: NifU family protein [Gemmatimonadota bacterium]